MPSIVSELGSHAKIDPGGNSLAESPPTSTVPAVVRTIVVSLIIDICTRIGTNKADT